MEVLIIHKLFYFHNQKKHVKITVYQIPSNHEYAHYPILYFYNSAGGSDSMFAEHRDDYRKLVAAVPALTDGKNAAFTEIRAASHSYKAWGTGLYNFLRVVFAQPEEPN